MYRSTSIINSALLVLRPKLVLLLTGVLQSYPSASLSASASDIYRCVPPTHEYGTRPFLRWARSQGRSPHGSGKAKNNFGIPLFGVPQAPGNNPPQNGVKAWGDGSLRPEEISSAEAHPAEPPRGKTAYRMQPMNWRRRLLYFCRKTRGMSHFTAIMKYKYVHSLSW